METKRLRKSASWMTETQKAFENLEDTKALSQIVLKIVRYMKDNGLTQKELAKRLNVTPQYVNKLLHGADSDLRITTALRYGRLLGLELIKVPGLQESPKAEKQQIIFKIQINTEQTALNDAISEAVVYYPRTINLNKKWHKKDSNLRA